MNTVKDTTQPVKRHARMVEVGPSTVRAAPVQLVTVGTNGELILTVLTDDERSALIIALGGQA